MKSKKYPNIKFEVSCLYDCKKEFKDIFFEVLDDYTQRFNAPVIKEKVLIQLCFVEYPLNENYSLGLCMFNEEDNIVLIQIKDPFLNECVFNTYTMNLLGSVLCHEYVHVCQYLTGRKGIKRPKMVIKPDDDRENYFFDTEELEARMLEAPYSSYYALNRL